MDELVAILNLDLGRELKDGWREVNCPYHYKQSKDAVFYVNCDFNSWNCYHACPGCPGVGRNNGIILTLYMLFTGTASRSEAANRIKEHLGRDNIAEHVKTHRRGKEEAETPKSPLADIEVRHRAYTTMLDMLTLAPKHFDDLIGRGLDEKQITHLGYKSVPVMGKYSVAKKLIAQGCILKGVPGFYVGNQGQAMANFGRPGFFIPVRDIMGRIEFLQIRHDEQTSKTKEGKKPPKYTNFSSSKKGLKGGTGVPYVAHFAGFPTDCKVPKKVSLTEGYLKCDISAALSQTPFVGFGSTSCFSLFKDVLSYLMRGGMEEAWDCMDKDRSFNNEVLDDIKEQYEIAKELGVPYKPYPWNPKYKGIDDFLAARDRHRRGQIIA